MKIMGIDYGDARTGVSISDPTGFLAGSPQVISTWNTEKLLDDLTALVQKEKIEEMISEAKEEGTYEEMKEEIEADIKRAKYLQTISIRKTK